MSQHHTQHDHHPRYPRLKRVAATFNIVATAMLILCGLGIAVLLAMVFTGNMPDDAWGFFMQTSGVAISALFLLAVGGVIKVLMDIEENTRLVREHKREHVREREHSVQ